MEKEIEFQLKMLYNKQIDEADFVNAITEIYEHYKTK